MKIYKVTEKDLIGEIEGFPIEVVQKMIERQLDQAGYCGISEFQRTNYDGFQWSETPEGYSFWCQVINCKNFDLFFERYPKQEDLPLPRKVLVWNDIESTAVERELIHILPDNLGLDYRYVTRYIMNPRDAVVYKNMRELPAPKKMTKEEAEEYILMNKPCLSINEVMNITYNPTETFTSTSNKLKELVKSKFKTK